MSGPVAIARPAQALRVRRDVKKPATRPSTMADDSAQTDARRYGMTAAS